MKTNVKNIMVEIPNKDTLKLITKTPSLNRLFRGKLHIGFNEQKVNHKQFADIERIAKTINIRIFK